MQIEFTYQVSPPVTNEELNLLFAAAWPGHIPSNFDSVLSRSLAYICARYNERLIGFVNLAWDGGIHAFVLDTTVHPDFQRRGVGRQLIQGAVAAAKGHNIEWLHVDYEPHLAYFYQQCGFGPTQAGLINLQRDEIT